MEGKYTYKGMGLTLDIYESIRDAVEAIAEDEALQCKIIPACFFVFKIVQYPVR